MEFGTRLQALRKERGLSQEALADRLGVSRQAIGKWESGGALPSIDNLLELAAILETTVDYLLTGAEPPAPEEQDPLAYGEPETVSVDALKALLAEQQPEPEPKKRKYLRRGLYGLAAAGLVVLLGLLWSYHARLSELESAVSLINVTVGSMDARVQGTLSGIQTDIQESLDQQASILSDWDCSPGDYDSETNTACLRLSATPKTLTEDTRLYFVLSPMGSSASTLDQPITVEGRIPATEGPSPGTFTAEVQVPMVQDFVVSVLLEQEGFRYTETMIQQYDFSSLYICTMTADSGDFSFTYTQGAKYLTVYGQPAVTVQAAASTSAPKPETLLFELYVDNELAYSETRDLLKYYVEDGTDWAIFYPNTLQDPKVPCDSNPSVHWRFVLTDTAGNEYVETIQMGE